MSGLTGLRRRIARISLQRKLPAAFAGVALLTMVALGAILIPLVNNHYSRSEASYLKAAAQEAVAGFAGVDWQAVAADGTGSSAASSRADALRRAQVVALSTQARVRIYDQAGDLVVDSGLPEDIDVVALTGATGTVQPGTHAGMGRGGMHGEHSLPSPVGGGLFGGGGSASGSRSERTVSAPLTSAGATVATLMLSDTPDYGSAVVRTTLVAWLIAGVVALVLAALAGWLYSRRLTKPLLAIAAASNDMARGDLSVRAGVARADEIGTLAESFDAMAEKNQATVTALRRFVADAAHELGTPLTALQSDLELAKDGPDKATRDRLIDRAITQAERIARLSAALLSLSLLDTGLQSKLQPLDLVPVLRSVGGSFASRAEQAGIDFTLDLRVAEMRVRGYETGLRTAVDNLVDNALKFTPSGGAVTIGADVVSRGAGPTGGQALVWVQDSGIGIPVEDRAALFSRFHRGRNAAAYPGSGLGLAIVQATMELHDGQASVTTSPAGSRFELRLPLL
jgi:signal transduction histidine kinase